MKTKINKESDWISFLPYIFMETKEKEKVNRGREARREEREGGRMEERRAGGRGAERIVSFVLFLWNLS